jgi:predicted restriction endonuclease
MTQPNKTDKTARRGWSREELIVAMNLYCKLPFGQLHQGNPEIIELARALDRTPGSIAMRLCNYASLDPTLQARSIEGLKGISKTGKEIWEEFHQDWEELAIESEKLFQQFITTSEAPENKLPTNAANAKENAISFPKSDFTGPTEGISPVRVRYAQGFFRRAVLASYDLRCCITDNPVPALLAASHIVPWRQSPQSHINPRNGLCLVRTLDTAFDRGLITLDEDRRLVLSNRLKDHLPNEAIDRQFTFYEGKPIRPPEKFTPKPEFLHYHREHIFLS